MKPVLSDRYLRVVSRLDRFILALVLLLAFLFGAFPARNSDVWMHLASGRLITHFDYSFGTDPFNFTTAGTYWANHGWLFDTGLYLVSALGGPEGVGGILAVILKGLAVVGLAWLMMQIRRPTQALWAPACSTALALVVLSPGLELRPMLASLLLLALTLLILVREGKPALAVDDKSWSFLWSASPRRLYALPVLFFLWVNLDGWFWLGPACVALYLLGDLLQERWSPIFSGREAANPEERRTLWKMLGLGLLACLISPHHVRALVLPPELGASSRFPQLIGDPLFASYFAGPFDSAYFTSALGMNVAGLAYYFLLALAAGTCALSWRWWRVVLLAAFALLSLHSMRLIPFFAVVAGPIIALNIHDFIEFEVGRKMADEVRLRRTALAGRGITIQTLIVFLVLAWAGWLHSPQAQRRFGLGIEADVSLKGAAEQIANWGQIRFAHRFGINDSIMHGPTEELPLGRALNLHPGLGDYFAWYSPGTKGFFDSRLELMGKSIDVYSRFLTWSNPATKKREGLDVILAKLRQERWHSHLIVLYGSSAPQTAALFSRLIQDAPPWQLLWMDGRSSIFGNINSLGMGLLTFKPESQLFGIESQRAPLVGPNRDPSVNYLKHFLFGAAPRPLDADLAEMYVIYYQAAGRRERDRRLGLWQAGYPAELVGTGISLAPMGAAPVEFAWRFTLPHLFRIRASEELLKGFMKQPDLGPPAAPLLAVRAARRANVENPDEPNAYLFLGQAYDLLWRLQENHWAGISTLPELSPTQLLRFLKQDKAPPPFSPWIARTLDHRQLMRQAQLVTALRQHLAGDPDSDFTHRSLYELFWKMNYYDVALDHLRAEVEILKRRLGGREPKLVAVRVQFLEEREQEVELLRGRYQQAGADGQRAFRPYGLVNEALKEIRQGRGMLQAGDVDLYLYLLLTTGRTGELALALAGNVDLPKLIGPRFHWYQGMLAATRGNYQEADQHLEQALKALPGLDVPLASLLQSLTADPPGLARVILRPILREVGTRSAASIVAIVRETAELELLRGLLALELGDVAAARKHLEQCLMRSAEESESARVAKRYLELLAK